MKKKIRVLIDGAGTATAISIIKGLRKQSDYEVFIVTDDMMEFNAGKYLSNKFYPVPRASAEEFIPTILDICKKEKIDLFFPIIEYGYAGIVSNRKLFDDIGTFVVIGPEETIKLTENKYKTYRFFKQHNIPTPKSYLSSDLPGMLKFPCFIKPNTFGRASIDAYKVENKEDLEFFMKKMNDPIVQEFIEGEEFTADCLNTLEGNELIACVARKRIETKGGLAVKSTIFPEKISKKIETTIQSFIKHVKLPGVCNVQGFVTKNDDLVFTEINPRFAGTHAFSIEAGLNTAKHIVDQHFGTSAEIIKAQIIINYSLKMVRYWEEIIVDNEKAYNPWKFWK